MPTYENANAYRVIVPTLYNGHVAIPASSSIELDYYISSLPLGITMTDTEPLVQPLIKIGDYTSFPTEEINVYMYPNIVINNLTDNSISLSANGDDDNALDILTNDSLTIINRSNWGSMKILTGGTGTVSVWGYTTSNV